MLLRYRYALLHVPRSVYRHRPMKTGGDTRKISPEAKKI